MREIEEYVASFGGRQFRQCYRDLCIAIEVERAHISERPPMKIICAEVGRRTKKNRKAVSKSLSRAIEDLWYYGDREKIMQCCGHKQSGKPTPQEFIYAAARELGNKTPEYV